MNLRIVMRVFRPNGRITDRFHTGRLARPGMTRTSPNPPVRMASGRIVREHIATTVGRWDTSGEQGRAELGELMRRAGNG